MIISKIVNQVINYFMQHIGEDIKIGDMGKRCNLSKYHYSRIFKEEMGESINAVIKRVSLELQPFRLKVKRGNTISDI